MGNLKPKVQGRVGWIVLAAALALVLMAAPVLAGAPVKVQVKVVMSGPKADLLPAGDDTNHMVGMSTRTGEAVFSDGRKAKYSNVYLMDFYRGKFVKSWGYTRMVFADGSWLFFKWDASFTGRDKANNPTMAGTGEIQKGTGKYKGIKGTAKFKNKILPPSKEFPNGHTVANAELTYTLP